MGIVCGRRLGKVQTWSGELGISSEHGPNVPLPLPQALKVTGLRGIIQKGWGGLGANVTAKFDDVLFIGQVRTCPGQLGV